MPGFRYCWRGGPKSIGYNTDMITVGLIGRIAAGKSTVAAALAARGAKVIDADGIAHEVLDDPAVVQEIVDLFGDGVLDAKGRVRRSSLAAEVFGPSPAHERALMALEGIVHPEVTRRIERRLDALGKAPEAGQTVVVLDVPLLVQVGLDDGCDQLVLVECDEKERQRRLDARDWPAEQRNARERAWEIGYHPPAPEKTVVVDATGDPAYTQKQVDQFWDSLRRD